MSDYKNCIIIWQALEENVYIISYNQIIFSDIIKTSMA